MADVTSMAANKCQNQLTFGMHFKLTILFTGFLFQQVSAQHVYFGERQPQSQHAAIYFDCEGSIYPDYFIADSALQACDAKLSSWYAQHPKDFRKIATRYHCSFADFTLQNASTLQDSISAEICRDLNRQQTGNMTFLIHGFRKNFTTANRDVSSPEEFILTERAIAQLDTSQQYQFVEVYWDAQYDCCFSRNQKRNALLFELFVQAQQNALPVGNSLRRILSGIQSEKINILAHSLGAKVAAAALFDIAGRAVIPPPRQSTVNLCLIAPAIAGEEIFCHYAERQGKKDLSAQDNYRLLILYNENDFVLRKKDNKTGLFGPGVYRYGNTSLGCNYRGEAEKLESYFQEHFPGSFIRLENLSAIGKCHSLRCYCVNAYLQPVVDFIR